MRKNEIEIHQGDFGGDCLGENLGRGGDNGFYLLLSCAASLAVAIIASAVASRILIGETASAGTYLVTTANVITTLVAVILWSISFVGMTRHLKSHYGNKHTGSYLLLSCAASLAVAIIAASVASRILMGETASAGTYWVITANVITALVAVILWSISFVGMFRYLKSHYGNKQGGQAVSL